MKFFQRKSKTTGKTDQDQIKAYLACLRTPDIPPSLTLLYKNFRNDGGYFMLLKNAQDIHEADIKNTAADYTNSTPPRIRLSDIADESTIMHELRHHDQARKLKERFNAASMESYVRLNSFIEADARAAQALLALERRDHLLRMAREGRRDPSHIQSITETFNRLSSNIETVEKTSGYKGLHRLYAGNFENAHFLSAAQKMQIMRNVFDSYIEQCRDDRHLYRQAEARRLRNIDSQIWPAKLWPAALTTIAGIAMTGSPALAALFTGILGIGQVTIMHKYFNRCAAHHKNDNAALLTILGTMPDGSGNYLTQTQGPALDSDFYHEIPDTHRQLIANKSAEIKRGLIPLATTIHKYTRRKKLGGPAQKPPLPPPS